MSVSASVTTQPISATASATVTGLTNGTAYTFRVAAVNGVGQGAWSSASSSVTPSAAVFREIPLMTSETTPSGIVSRSDEGVLWNAAWYGGSNDQFWRVFDRSGTPGLFLGNDKWIQYAFPENQTSSASGYRMRGAQYVGQGPKTILLQASNDGATFTTIDSQADLSWSSYEDKQFTFSGPAMFRYWRWTISNSQFYDGSRVGYIQLLQ